MNLQRIGLWPARVLWLGLPLVVGWGLRETTESLLSGPRLTIEIVGWILWFGGLLATFAPSTISITVIRMLAPAIVGFGLLVGVATGTWPQSLLVALAYGLLVTTVVFMPTFGDRMVNGSAYGSERRMALRPPAFALFGPIQLIWLLSFVGLACAPLLIANERYIEAVIATIVGAGLIYVAGKILHQFARRWIVFVPAGFVIHDPLTLVDSVLFRRSSIKALGPALAGEPSSPDTASSSSAPSESGEVTDLDLSGGAPGLALTVATKEALPVTIRPAGVFSGGSPIDTGGIIKNIQTTTITFTPTLPGALLQEARVRGVKIDVAEAPPPEPGDANSADSAR